ncbi:molybdate ABC transporter substrate-binding protein [Pseudoduganella dura]|nr:molybdate ABC transporter substrate-binding protein [Pseudoduganella dura]
MMKLFSSLTLALLAMAFSTAKVHCAELVVGAPSELAGYVDALSSAFIAGEKGARLRFVLDTSGNLYEKVSAGEPLDVYMSDDLRLQGQLLADGKMVYDTWTMYAAGRIVLWSMDKRFDVAKGLRLLADPAVKKVAVADGGSPYMAPSLAALHHAGLLEKLQPRLLDSHSMQEMVKSVRAGKAELAILSYDTVLAPSMKGVGRYYLIPENEYKDDIPGHAAVVTLHGRQNPLAHRFIRFLRTARAQAILLPGGFMKPPPESVDIR